jgi:hypothetical protein
VQVDERGPEVELAEFVATTAKEFDIPGCPSGYWWTARRSVRLTG